MDLSFLYPIGWAVPNAEGVYEIPFLDRMTIVFAICVIGVFFISKKENQKGITPNGLEIDTKMFKVSPGFMVGSLVVLAIIQALYTIFW